MFGSADVRKRGGRDIYSQPFGEFVAYDEDKSRRSSRKRVVVVFASIVVGLLVCALVFYRMSSDTDAERGEKPVYTRLRDTEVEAPQQKTSSARESESTENTIGNAVVEEREFRDLIQWLKTHGAVWENVVVGSTPGMGRGLIATADIPEGEQIMVIGDDLWLTVKTEHTDIANVMRHIEEKNLFQEAAMRLAILLMYERKNPASFFKPYIAALPDPTTPVWFTEKEFDELQSPLIVEWSISQRDHTIAQFEEIQTVLGAAFPKLFHKNAFTLKEWQWAISTVYQRSFSVDIQGEGVWVMVPWMDFCNHDGSIENSYYHEEYGWRFLASNEWKTGEQVLINYGSAKSNVDFFLFYGFVARNNELDTVEITLELHDDDPNFEQKHILIDELGLKTSCHVGPSGAIPRSFENAASVMLMESSEFPDKLNWQDKTYDGKALETIRSKVTEKLSSFPTTIHDDERILSRPGTHTLHTAVAYRLSFKRTMLQIVTSLDAKLALENRGTHATVVESTEESDEDAFSLFSIQVPIHVTN